MKKRLAFRGKITISDSKFKKGTPNVMTVHPPSTSASSTSNVSICTAQLLAKKQGSGKLLSVAGTGGDWVVTSNNKDKLQKQGNGRRKKSKKKAVPDFFTPEKGVLLLGTLRPNGLRDRYDQDSSEDRPNSPSQELVLPRAPESMIIGTSISRQVSITNKLPNSSAGNGRIKVTKNTRNTRKTTAVVTATTTTTTTKDKGNEESSTKSFKESPTTSDSSESSDTSNNPPSIVLSWQHLGSPVRRMKRAMRFVQQNTCVTQRVTVDIGSIARLVIPCFEGITTVSDLVETAHCRFPTYGISGLRQPGTNIGRHAWDANHHRVEMEKTDSFSIAAILNPHDFVSVAVGSDAALVAVGSNIPDAVPEEDGGIFSEDDMMPVSAREEEVQMVEKQRITELTGETVKENNPESAYTTTTGTQGDEATKIKISPPPVAQFRHSLLPVQKTDDKEKVSKQEPPPTPIRKGTNSTEMSQEDMKSKKSQSAMAKAVRDRLMLRIQSLADKGQITASQRGYLDHLVVASPLGSPAAYKSESPPSSSHGETSDEKDSKINDFSFEGEQISSKPTPNPTNPTIPTKPVTTGTSQVNNEPSPPTSASGTRRPLNNPRRKHFIDANAKNKTVQIRPPPPEC